MMSKFIDKIIMQIVEDINNGDIIALSLMNKKK